VTEGATERGHVFVYLHRTAIILVHTDTFNIGCLNILRPLPAVIIVIIHAANIMIRIGGIGPADSQPDGTGTGTGTGTGS